MVMSSSALTFRGSDGRSLPAVQPDANSVSGSPFTVTSGASVETPELHGLGIMVFATQLVHIRFSRDGDAADANDIMIPPSTLITFPLEAGDVLSMIADSTTADVYVELVRVK